MAGAARRRRGGARYAGHHRPPLPANDIRPRVTAVPNGPGHGATSGTAGTEPGGRSGPGQPVEELGLPLRAFNSLRREGIHTVADLCARNEADLLAIANLGPASVKEIKQKLAERGLALAPAGTATGPAGTATGPAGTATAAAGAVPAAANAARDADELAAAPPLTARPPDEDAIDLLSVAGFPVLKRALPIAGAAVVLLILLRARRRHHRRARTGTS